VWVYAAQGKVVASGMSAATPLHALGHSAWVSGVDPKYLKGGSIYGPGANGLSALFASASGGHPWIAVEGWRHDMSHRDISYISPSIASRSTSEAG